MVERFLITTADQRTWKLGTPILFLGSWCKLFSDKELWKRQDTSTLEYHWDDRHQVIRDHEYLNTLYENLLESLTKSLNSIHDVDYKSDYWRILIGPWLYYFSQTIFDR